MEHILYLLHEHLNMAIEIVALHEHYSTRCGESPLGYPPKLVGISRIGVYTSSVTIGESVHW